MDLYVASGARVTYELRVGISARRCGRFELSGAKSAFPPPPFLLKFCWLAIHCSSVMDILSCSSAGRLRRMRRS